MFVILTERIRFWIAIDSPSEYAPAAAMRPCGDREQEDVRQVAFVFYISLRVALAMALPMYDESIISCALVLCSLRS